MFLCERQPGVNSVTFSFYEFSLAVTEDSGAGSTYDPLGQGTEDQAKDAEVF